LVLVTILSSSEHWQKCLNRQAPLSCGEEEPSPSPKRNAESVSAHRPDNHKPIPLEWLSIHEPIAHYKSEELRVQSTRFQSNSWSARNGSITQRNRFLTRRRRTKQSAVVRNTSGNSVHSSLKGFEASYGNERSTGDKVSLDPSVLRIEDVVDPPLLSGGGASTSEDSESWKVLVIKKEGKAQTRFVRVSSAF
jgi:hypothetical protein